MVDYACYKTSACNGTGAVDNYIPDELLNSKYAPSRQSLIFYLKKCLVEQSLYAYNIIILICDYSLFIYYCDIVLVF